MKMKLGFVSNSSSTSFLINQTKHSGFSKDIIEGMLSKMNALGDIKVVEYVGNPYDSWDEYYSCLRDIGKDDVIIAIESVCDNSIPYDFQEWLEANLSCDRIHLG